MALGGNGSEVGHFHNAIHNSFWEKERIEDVSAGLQYIAKTTIVPLGLASHATLPGLLSRDDAVTRCMPMFLHSIPRHNRTEKPVASPISPGETSPQRRMTCCFDSVANQQTDARGGVFGSLRLADHEGAGEIAPGVGCEDEGGGSCAVGVAGHVGRDHGQGDGEGDGLRVGQPEGDQPGPRLRAREEGDEGCCCLVRVA
jgi:hypothetical protein